MIKLFKKSTIFRLTMEYTRLNTTLQKNDMTV